MRKVVIIDYQLGNLFSVNQACEVVGMNALISSDKEDIKRADALILPGVGAFNEAMRNLRMLELDEIIVEKVKSGTPIFGICLGLQLLFSESEEFGASKGLDLVSGVIKRFPATFQGRVIRIPQIAWNTIYCKDNPWMGTELRNIINNEFMYFVHSYYVRPDSSNCILTLTNYDGIEYCSAIKINNIFATQFHPEKSAERGISIYRNWALLNKLI